MFGEKCTQLRIYTLGASVKTHNTDRTLNLSKISYDL